jgi:molybdopterin-biosynthesis enzyme MoeA-like protein
MAGIPAVMQAMLEDIRPRLTAGAKLSSRTLSVYLGEGRIAKGLADVQKRFPDVPLGSYPFTREGRFGTSLVARGNDENRLIEAAEALKAMIREAGGEPVEGEPV